MNDESAISSHILVTNLWQVHSHSGSILCKSIDRGLQHTCIPFPKLFRTDPARLMFAESRFRGKEIGDWFVYFERKSAVWKSCSLFRTVLSGFLYSVGHVWACTNRACRQKNDCQETSRTWVTLSHRIWTHFAFRTEYRRFIALSVSLSFRNRVEEVKNDLGCTAVFFYLCRNLK